jgi:hypothetical protein
MSKDVTIEGLAAMIQNGFEDTNERIERGFADVNGRLDRIEKNILADHEFRLTRLENALTPSRSQALRLD